MLIDEITPSIEKDGKLLSLRGIFENEYLAKRKAEKLYKSRLMVTEIKEYEGGFFLYARHPGCKPYHQKLIEALGYALYAEFVLEETRKEDRDLYRLSGIYEKKLSESKGELVKPKPSLIEKLEYYVDYLDSEHYHDTF